MTTKEDHSISLPAVYDSYSSLLQKSTLEKKLPQFIAAFIVSLTAFSAGTSIGWTSQISEKLLGGELGFTITKNELSWIASLTSLGAAVFSIFAGPLCDKFGRKPSAFLFIVPSLTGWTLILWSKSIGMVYAGRFLTGMSTGALCVFTALYNNEIAQKEVRGTLGSFLQLMISSGILFDAIVAKFVNMKLYTALCGGVPMVFGALFAFMPESPVYSVQKRDYVGARATLIWLRGKNYNVDQEMKEIEQYVLDKNKCSGTNTLKNCMKTRASKIACVIGFGLMIFKCICGIDAITAYTSYIFTNANIGLNAQSATIILASFSTGAGIFQSLVVDKCGRRTLLMLSSGAMTVCLTIVGIVLMLKGRYAFSEEIYKYINYLPVVALTVFEVAYSLGLGPISWLMMGEVFPQEIKSLASSLATFVSWIVTFAVTGLFMVVNTELGGDFAFLLFAVCTLAATLFTFFLVPETKNKSYLEIQSAL
ncbi:hypothetical protein PPYR_05193 [Photinus pyralis]|uniref:Major facilitator superfamily (MFS) profile domain-containing protein n=1 Tax=Photinus pyralis TaxID=7054 RepID=A0A1Y1KRE5_PHOPY|nr:facilitated trehalose transporter Tret1-like [Photinus pyralis]KAB0803007.1 hypothetical protein PPYR_05193 [Photinus pyralis]